jgi:hypothetical protein
MRIEKAVPGSPNWEAQIIGLDPIRSARAEVITRELSWEYDLA